MVGGPQASTTDRQGSAPVSCCPPYAKVPSGELISEDFLTKCLPDAGAKVDRFGVDEASLLVGRHSTTFRLQLEWSPFSTDKPEPAGGSTAAAATAVTGQNHDDDAVQPDGSKADGGCDPVSSVFVKRMTCRELPARTLIKWRTSIASYRAEATFFKTVAGSNALGAIVPDAFWVHVDDRLGEQGATGGVDGGGDADGKQQQQDEEEVMKGLQESCFMMITEDLGAGWEQTVALDLERAKAVFSAVAHLHASFWPTPAESESGGLSPPPPAAAAGGEGEADRAGGRRYARGLHEQGTFWNLDKRNPEDLEGLEREYENLLGRFRLLLPASWFEPAQQEGRGRGAAPSLGRRLASRALDLDAAVLGREGGSSLSRGDDVGRVASRGGRRGRTLVHGDLKTWNVFFRKGAWGEVGAGGTGSGGGGGCGGGSGGKASTAPARGRVKIIDWQWCGEGLAAADVAYVMCTSLEPSVLLSGEKELLDHYHAELSRGLEDRFGKPPGGGGEGEGSSRSSWYPMEQLKDDYRVAFLDYMRCVVGTLWKGLTPEKMENNRTSGPGLSLINRSIQHMQWMIERATRLLDELDHLEENK